MSSTRCRWYIGLLGASLFVAACGMFDDDVSDWSVSESRAFDGFALWWLGEEHGGERLESILAAPLDEGDDEIGSVAFLYGTCAPVGDGGCPSPYQLIVEPNCDRPAFGSVVVVRGFRGESELTEFPDGHFRVETGTVAMTLFASTRAEAFKMAQDIEPLNGAAPGGLLAAPEDGCDLLRRSN